MTTTEELLGVTTCPTCQKRFRILKKHESFIGKSIQCPKCKRPFVIQLEAPAPIEQAAMANAASNNGNGEPVAQAQADGVQSKPKRRSRAEVRKARYQRLRKEFRPFMRRLTAIASDANKSEEKVRIWCIDVLRTALGYKDEDLDLELCAVGKKIDIAIKHEGNVIMIIECKNIDSKLPKYAFDQAVNYAANKSASWAVVTNGQDWSLHRVIPVKGQDSRVVEVFNISLLDDDGLSAYDAERMYLLTKKALTKGESEQEFHKARCLANERLLDAMTSERVIEAARKVLIKSYEKEFRERVQLSSEDVCERLVELTRPSEL